MSVRNILLATALSGVLAFGLTAIPVDTASAEQLKGKVTKTAGEGRKVTIGGKQFRISGSRTKVTIGGKEADREEIKKGMKCTVNAADRKGRFEAKTVKC
jgi:hypothetical protein